MKWLGKSYSERLRENKKKFRGLGMPRVKKKKISPRFFFRAIKLGAILDLQVA